TSATAVCTPPAPAPRLLAAANCVPANMCPHAWRPARLPPSYSATSTIPRAKLPACRVTAMRSASSNGWAPNPRSTTAPRGHGSARPPRSRTQRVGQPILAAAGFQPASRLKGGCGQDCPPHNGSGSGIDPGRRLGLGANPSAAGPPEVRAHESAPPFQIRVETNLVMVKVVVRDAKGRPVAGLRKEDFRLFDSGKPQDITGFAAETAAPK